MKKSIFRGVIAFIVLIYLQSCQNNHNNKTADQNQHIDIAGAKFIRSGTEESSSEIKASELVKSHSKNARVSSLATMIIAGHTRLIQRLKSIADSGSVKANEAISAEHSKIIGELSKKEALDFDKSYVQLMSKNHEQAVITYIQATQNKNAKVQDFAKAMLPIIQVELDSSRSVGRSLK